MEMEHIKATKEKLLELIYKRSFRYDPNMGFRLSSGKMSDVYIDLKKVTTTSDGAFLTGEAVYDVIKDLPLSAIGGLTLGADPIAYATMMVSSLKDKHFNVFIIRKSVKDYGTRRTIEGCFDKGDKVVILDDVVTTGKSTIEAITKARSAGLEILKVISIVDREEGGAGEIKKHVDDYTPVFTKSDLIRLAHDKRH